MTLSRSILYIIIDFNYCTCLSRTYITDLLQFVKIIIFTGYRLCQRNVAGGIDQYNNLALIVDEKYISRMWKVICKWIIFDKYGF